MFVKTLDTDSEMRSKYSTGANFFTRKRCLSMAMTAVALIRLIRHTIQEEMEDIFFELGRSADAAPTPSAFCQRRALLKPELFRDLARLLASRLASNCPERGLWHGMRLLAIDGSMVRMHPNPDLDAYFGVLHTGQGDATQALVNTLYDIGNDMIADVWAVPFKIGEKALSIEMVRGLGPRDLAIFDRGYTSFRLVDALKQAGCHFVIRSALRFSRSTASFMESGETDGFVDMEVTRATYRKLPKETPRLPIGTKIRVRAVKVPLPTGETELLLTDLPPSVTPDDLKELYFMRWKTEVAYGYMKNELQLQQFSSRKHDGVLQDIYCVCVMYNLESLFSMLDEESLARINEANEASGKRAVGISKNHSWGVLRRELPIWIMGESGDEIAVVIAKTFLKGLKPIRRRKSYPRVFSKRKVLASYFIRGNYRMAL